MIHFQFSLSLHGSDTINVLRIFNLDVLVFFLFHKIKETSGEYWIKKLGLKNEDKKILKSQRMLNDRHTNAARKLLKKKFPRISGLQDTILSQTSFVNTQGEGIQIHNTGAYHWITSSSIGIYIYL